MELFISFVVGVVTGLVYNEHLYRQARNFPNSSPMMGFWLRLLFTGVIALILAERFGAKALLLFLAGNLVARFLHTLVRGFAVKILGWKH
ncbi:N-ATPase subunit AtpR [Hydrogenivirga sp.]